jgi:hypothetical protein
MKFQDETSGCKVENLRDLLSCKIPGLEAWVGQFLFLISAAVYTLGQARGKVVAFLYGDISGSWGQRGEIRKHRQAGRKILPQHEAYPGIHPEFEWDDPNVDNLAQVVLSSYYSSVPGQFKFIEAAAYCGGAEPRPRSWQTRRRTPSCCPRSRQRESLPPGRQSPRGTCSFPSPASSDRWP